MNFKLFILIVGLIIMSSCSTLNSDVLAVIENSDSVRVERMFSSEADKEFVKDDLKQIYTYLKKSKACIPSPGSEEYMLHFLKDDNKLLKLWVYGNGEWGVYESLSFSSKSRGENISLIQYLNNSRSLK